MEENKKNKSNSKVKEISEENECFVIMPIGDCDGYETGHFKRVYDSIIKPGIKNAGFKPYRADDNESSRIIHMDIIKKLIEAPMAICDLTTRNPNVLYELGIRQAFDKPVFIIQEKGTERIFDINIISTVDYEKGFEYENVIAAQESIRDGILATFNNEKDDVNSLISLIKVSAAILPTKEEINSISDNSMFKMIMNQLNYLNKKINEINNERATLKDESKNNDNKECLRGHKYIITEDGKIRKVFTNRGVVIEKKDNLENKVKTIDDEENFIAEILLDKEDLALKDRIFTRESKKQEKDYIIVKKDM
ncbi:TPA: hypothetical protein I9080_000495 [Clostridium perfringens]|uniref:Nucleoside 2-deoxyribosyltransferase n=1 Tax=Clostridium perfringens TaxID=1502 RepID=A0A8H9UVP9_CLOPF|nr:hypothetical protein [Clostridium perfringens]